MNFPESLPVLLTDLISIPSVGPGYDPAGSEPGEARMAAHVAELLRALGAEVAVTEVSSGRPNVVGRFPAQGVDAAVAPMVALVPHLDTVGAGGMTVPPFAATRAEGRIYGRGACDTKGPMAAALWALAEWWRSPAAKDGRVTWVFAATMGEEEMSTGASALCATGFRADFAIALEPTGLEVVHAEKGVLRLWVEARGRAAHASTPERGVNAIYRMGAFLKACEERLGPELARAAHPRLGPVSLNVGLIEGGRALNVVPDVCRVGLDLRTHPELPNAAVLERVRAEAAGLDVTVHKDGPAYALERGHPWLEALAAAGRGTAVAPWFSDANVFNAHGIPAVAFGPGGIAQAHTEDEYIVEAELAAGAEALGRFIAETSARPPVRTS